jgi:plastocyanin
MRSIIRGVATLATAVALAACSGTATSAPTTAGTQAAPASVAPGGAAVCADSTGATTVEATVGGFQWGPVTAKVGDVITWTNTDSAPHKVGLDDGSCTMSGNIDGGGGKASLVFSVAGTYPFHCTIHSSMKGTITITQ